MEGEDHGESEAKGWGEKTLNKLGSVKILPLCAEGSGGLASVRPTCTPKPPPHGFSTAQRKNKLTFLATSSGNLTDSATQTSEVLPTTAG